MIRVHVLQVNARLAEEMDLLCRSVRAGQTIEDWQSLKNAKAGDIAVWYVAGGPQEYAVWGWVSGPSVRVTPGEPFGLYQGPVTGMRWLPARVSRATVRDGSGVDSGARPGPQTVPDGQAAAFLIAVGLLAQPSP
jgi:hypothetical protein